MSDDYQHGVSPTRILCCDVLMTGSQCCEFKTGVIYSQFRVLVASLAGYLGDDTGEHHDSPARSSL